MVNCYKTNRKDQFFIIKTKFGFIKEVFEDYTDIDNSNPLSIFYNMSFTYDPRDAETFTSMDSSTPKYATSKLHSYKDLTLDKWVEELNAEIILCEMSKYFSQDFDIHGKFCSEQITKFVVVDSEKFNKDTEFEDFDYESLEV